MWFVYILRNLYPGDFPECALDADFVDFEQQEFI